MIGKAQQFILERALSVLNDNANFEDFPLNIPCHSERLAEVPWAAKYLRDARTILDIGFAMSSFDWLGLLLAAGQREHTSIQAVDIVRPQRVATRYPDPWRKQILQTPIIIGDIRTCELPREHFDLISCISTIEHIGFDVASTDDPNSAFLRGKTPAQIADGRDPNTNADVLAAFHRALQPGGRVMLSVPMGGGGPTLLKDSLGLYTRQWEYEDESWRELTHAAGFSMLEQRFFALGSDDCWSEVDGPAALDQKSSELQPHASGCALLALRKD